MGKRTYPIASFGKAVSWGGNIKNMCVYVFFYSFIVFLNEKPARLWAEKKGVGLTRSPAGFREGRADLGEIRGWLKAFGACE